MDPVMYVLLEPTAPFVGVNDPGDFPYALLKPTVPFIGVNDPGNFPVYAYFATKATMKMTDKQFEHDKNYYLSFVNIN
jgi:hypothetical protein